MKAGMKTGKIDAMIELILKNYKKLSPEEASNIFDCDWNLVIEIYRILDVQSENVGTEYVKQKLLEGGFIEVPVFETQTF